jgi:hypothetical protein
LKEISFHGHNSRKQHTRTLQRLQPPVRHLHLPALRDAHLLAAMFHDTQGPRGVFR